MKSARERVLHACRHVFIGLVFAGAVLVLAPVYGQEQKKKTFGQGTKPDVPASGQTKTGQTQGEQGKPKKSEPAAKSQAPAKPSHGSQATPTTSAQDKSRPTVATPIPSSWIGQMNWRCIGPANMGGRITAIAVYENDPSTYWVATASGGLLKTTNNGVTFVHQFDRENTVSIGDVAVAPSNPNIVWVGTGENNPRNSVSYGDGVYKSLDGGRTWQHMGLRNSFQIGKIVIHPTNPDIVYVGALGRLYGPNDERGLFKTTDGGKTWQRVLFVDENTGVIDIRMHPQDPDTLLVATWERRRDAFDSYIGETPPDGLDGYDPLVRWGKGSGIYKTTDGGRTFRRITKGLPTNPLGRIGLDYYRSNPNIVYAIVDCEKIGMGPVPKTIAQRAFLGFVAENVGEDEGIRVTMVMPRGPAQQAGIEVDDVITRIAGTSIKNTDDFNALLEKLKPEEKVRLAVTRGNQTRDVEVVVSTRPAFGGPYLGVQGEDAGDPKGARLIQVVEEGPAAKAGLQIGDIVTAVNNQKVPTYGDLLQVIRTLTPGDKVKLTVVRDQKTHTVELVLGERPGFAGFGESGGPTPRRPYRATLGGQRENVQDQQGPDGYQYGGVYRSTDGGETWTRVNSVNPRPMYFSQIRVDPSDDRYVYVLGVSLYRSADGGKTFRADVRGIHADQHALWINPRDGRHMIVGTDGGFYVTYDRMNTWDHLNHMALGQFYHVAVCTKKPYWVYGGLQDNGSWGGPSIGLKGGIGPINEDWISIGGGDGFVCRVDPNDPDLVYYESQNGNMGRVHLKTGERAVIRPQRRPGQPAFRFNWNTPFILSHHNSKVFYCAGNYVFRSLDRGNDLRIVSPEITLTKRGSATALAESPRNPEVLWVGTDDGALWVTRDGGKNWTRVNERLGLKQPLWIATIEASRFVEGRAYVAIDAHRCDDDRPYLFVTEDFGQSWRNISANLPEFGSTRCLREDVENPNVLYCGTEFAIYVSIDRGLSWTKLHNNLPTVAVHEVAVHPTAGEIVAATHGRSLWILDVTVLRQMTPEIVRSDRPHLFKPNTAIRWPIEPRHGGTNRRFVGQNPPPGAQIFYKLAQKAGKVTLTVFDIEGNAVRQFNGPTDPGLHRLTWDLTRLVRAQTTAESGPRAGTRTRTGQFGRPFGQPGGFAGRGPMQARRPVPPGAYRLVLHVDGQEFSTVLQVEGEARPLSGFFAGEEEHAGEYEKSSEDDADVPTRPPSEHDSIG